MIKIVDLEGNDTLVCKIDKNTLLGLLKIDNEIHKNIHASSFVDMDFTSMHDVSKRIDSLSDRMKTINNELISTLRS